MFKKLIQKTECKEKPKSREQCFYDFLMECYKHNPNEWVSKREIANRLKYFYKPNSMQTDRNSTAYRKIRQDKRFCNASDNFKRLIISSSKHCYKIATNEELIQFAKKQRTELINILNFYSEIFNKSNFNSECKIFLSESEMKLLELFERKKE